MTENLYLCEISEVAASDTCANRAGAAHISKKANVIYAVGFFAFQPYNPHRRRNRGSTAVWLALRNDYRNYDTEYLFSFNDCVALSAFKLVGETIKADL